MIFQSGVFLQNFVSVTSLEIEKGRYNKTPCEERLCKIVESLKMKLILF